MRNARWVLLLALFGLITYSLPLSAEISGTVIDSATSAPLEGALVTLQTTETRTTTDADGFFEFPDLEGTDLVIVAALKGYFHGAKTVTSPDTAVEIAMDAVPQDDDEDYDFVPPIFCEMCHPKQYGEYTQSRMAKTGLNQWVYDVFNGTGTAGGMGGFVYTEDSVQKDAKPNGECAGCHQPVRWIKNGRDAALGDITAPASDMRAGVSCEICHKMANVNVDNIGMPGPHLAVATITRPAGPNFNQVEYGVRGDVSYISVGEMRPSYQPQIVAETCGVCHDENTDPDMDEDRFEEGSVQAQSTYRDWKASKYGEVGGEHYRSCAGCHIPAKDPDTDFVICEVLDPGLLRPGSQLHYHKIEGTDPTHIENAVTMSVTAELVEDQIVATVSIENDQTGHAVPGGVPIRHLILLVEAETGTGESLVSTGTQTVDSIGGIGDPAEGYYEGLPGKVFAKILEDADGNFPVFYTETAAIHYDTRIAAEATDTTEYSFTLPASASEVTVRARLIYRRAYRAWVDAKGWTVEGQGGTLEDIAAPNFGHLMEEGTAVVTLAPPPPRLVRGDVDGSGDLLLTDAILLLNHLFNSFDINCRDASDFNDDGRLNLQDPILLLSYMFTGGDDPEAPFPDCGVDTTTDFGDVDLGCKGPVEGCP